MSRTELLAIMSAIIDTKDNYDVSPIARAIQLLHAIESRTAKEALERMTEAHP